MFMFEEIQGTLIIPNHLFKEQRQEKELFKWKIQFCFLAKKKAVKNIKNKLVKNL